MHRVLIADTAELFAEAVQSQLQNAYHVEICHDGTRAMELLNSFDPDILILDSMLPGTDSWTILNAVRDSGRMIQVIVTARTPAESIMQRLSRLGVSNVFTKPCHIGSVVACIRDLSFYLMHPTDDSWYLENELDGKLLRFGFQLGTQRYNCVYHAILYRYYEPNSSVTKQLYPAVAKICGGSANRIEKAIRDAIREAFEKGLDQIWALYFPSGTETLLQCPSNDVFISRMAASLRQHSRMKAPLDQVTKIAK